MMLALYSALRSALVGRLAGDPAVAAVLPAIYERPPGDARPPWLAIEPGLLADWSNKTAAGLAAEIRLILLLVEDDDAAAENAAQTVLQALTPWPPLADARLVRLAVREIRITRPGHAGRRVTIQIEALVAENPAA
ncbi:MAG: DUF3168 domain-containing protein [Alphaproteobacteria bacterium]|nr:MAG: DUF3168 domain-containing protein [Alphaproteobacteria bacterium]